MLSKKKKVEGGVRETINHKEMDIREKQQFLSHSAKVISITEPLFQYSLKE